MPTPKLNWDRKFNSVEKHLARIDAQLLTIEHILRLLVGEKGKPRLTLTEAIQSFANGIAIAEGFYVSGSRPQRNNNPGDLTVDTIGKGVGMDGIFVIYPDVATGWEALYKQVELILTDASHIYNSGMTLREIAAKYTTTDQLAWANNVASAIGIDIDTPVSTLISTATQVAEIGIGTIVVAILIWYLVSKGKGK